MSSRKPETVVVDELEETVFPAPGCQGAGGFVGQKLSAVLQYHHALDAVNPPVCTQSAHKAAKAVPGPDSTAHPDGGHATKCKLA